MHVYGRTGARDGADSSSDSQEHARRGEEDSSEGASLSEDWLLAAEREVTLHKYSTRM